MMRAASYRPGSRRPGGNSITLPYHRLGSGPLKAPSFSFVSAVCGGCFLVGYLPGILLGRTGAGILGEQLAAYYSNPAQFTSWLDVCLNEMAAAFLQLLFLVFCGFSVAGSVFLLMFFLGKGAFLGYCAVYVLAQGGGNALAFYWLCVCLPNILLLFFHLWLAGYAAELSIRLFQTVFGSGAPHGRVEAAVRRLLVRSCVSLIGSCLLSLFCSGFTVFLSRLLL